MAHAHALYALIVHRCRRPPRIRQHVQYWVEEDYKSKVPLAKWMKRNREGLPYAEGCPHSQPPAPAPAIHPTVYKKAAHTQPLPHPHAIMPHQRDRLT